MKGLDKLEKHIGRYGEQLLKPSIPPAVKQTKWIQEEVRAMLDRNLAAQSSRPELTQHFSDLFSGLEKISDPSAKPPANPLAPENSEKDILAAFDELYFRSLASFNLTTKILMDPRITNVDHFVRAVSQGGTILRSWTVAQREMFQLHAANKLWRLGRRAEARHKLDSDYRSLWCGRLAQTETQLPALSLKILTRALVATEAVPLAQLLADVRNWRSLFVVWQQYVTVYKRPIEPHLAASLGDISGSPLWRALEHISAREMSVPEALTFVPATHDRGIRQIRLAILHFARDHKDMELLDLLLESNDGEDAAIEAGAWAAKLAIA